MWQATKNIYHLLVAIGANAYYGFPAKKLKVIGVTGTSGKTTTANLIFIVLREAGFKVSMISTIKAVIAGKEYDTGFHVTTPDPHILPKFLKEAVNAGDTHFVLEISSHALDQNRAGLVPFAIGVLTTLAHEHLDYHKTFVNYAKAKCKLLHQAGKVVIPEGGISEEVKEAIGFRDIEKKAITFGIKNGDVNQKDWNIKIDMPGEFNIKNALAAASVAKLLGVKKEIVKESLRHIASLPGRFEEIPTKTGFRVIIDFAHKPDALESVLETARKQIKKGGRVIVLFGAASQRDILKRPIMGRIAAQFADITVLTDEDPRFEDPLKIINEIARGCEEGGAKEFQISNFLPRGKAGKYPIPNGRVYFKISNRKDAIHFIITKLACTGDIILLCGKGHEASMNYNGIEKSWNEYEVAKKALSMRLG